MKLEMYIDVEDFKILLSSYFSKMENQKVMFAIKKDYEEILFEYRRFERIKNVPVIISVTLNLDEVKDVLANISDKYTIENINTIFDDDEEEICGFSIGVKEKSPNLLLKNKK